MTYEEFLDEVKQILVVEQHIDPKAIRFIPKGYSGKDEDEAYAIRLANTSFFGVDTDVMQRDFLFVGRSIGKRTMVLQRMPIRQMYDYTKHEGGLEYSLNLVRNPQLPDPETELNENSEQQDEYEMQKDLLMVRPMNLTRFGTEISDCIYRAVGDVALVLYIYMGRGSNGGFYSMKVRREMLDVWGIKKEDEEHLIDLAIENTARLFPATVLNPVSGRNEEFLGKQFPEITFLTRDGKLLLLGSMYNGDGAAAIFYPEVQKQVLRHMKDRPAYVFFVNVNNAAVCDSPGMTRRFFGDVARQDTNYGQHLSDKLYLCDETGVHLVEEPDAVPVS